MRSVVDACASRLAASIPAPLMIVDARGRIAAMNPRLEALVGRSMHDLVGREWRALALPPGGDDHDLEGEGPPASSLISRVVAADGALRELAWEVEALALGEGDAPHFVCVASDVTRDLALARRVGALEDELAAVRCRADALIGAFPGWVSILDGAGRVIGRSDAGEGEDGMRVWDLPVIAHRPDLQAAARDAFARAAQGESVRLAAAGVRSTETFDHEVSFHPLRSASGEVANVAVFGIDVRERNEAIAALRESEERLNEAQEIARLGSWSLDLASDRLIWSDEIFRIFELDRRTFGASYEAFLAAVHPDDRDLVHCTYLRSLSTRERYEIVHRLRMSDGRVKFVREIGHSIYDEGGAPIRSIGTVQDISAEVRAERRLRALLDGLPASVTVFDLEGRVVGSNRAPGRPEVPPDELIGLRADALPWLAHSAEDGRRALAAIAAARAGEVARAELRLELADQTQAIYEYTFAPIEDDDGEIELVVASGVDITARIRADRALQRALAERETLLREIHHRVKNNLQVISSLLHFQAKRATTPADVAAFAEGRERLLAMILVHEKLYQSRELSRVPFADYVRELTGALLTSIDQQRRIEIVLAIDDVRLPIEVALPAGMILCELLTNAFKYSFPAPRGGRVEITARRVGDALHLAICDDGVGLPAGFDPAALTSFGWHLIRNLSAQLDATLTIVEATGAHVAIVIPLGDELAAAAPCEAVGP